MGEKLLESHGARSAPRLSYNFPGSTCISINEEAAHGIPGDRVIQAGDVLNVDVSAELGGYFADTGGTKVVPPTSPTKTRLCHATRTALEQATKQARAGLSLNGIGAAIQKTAKTYGFRIIENLEHELIPRGTHTEVIHRVTLAGLLSSVFGPVLDKQLNAGLPVTLANLRRLVEAQAG